MGTRAASGAIDSHMHLFAGDAVGTGWADPISECRAFMARNGVSRAVLIQSEDHPHLTGLLDALAAFGPDARGMAILFDPTSDRDLDLLGAQGVVGVRYLRDPGRGQERVADRAAERGWLTEISCAVDALPEREVWLRRRPGRIVLEVGGDCAHRPDDAGLAVLLRLVDSGRAWIKLCGTVLSEPSLARLVRHAPERCIWGSNWPRSSAAPPSVAVWLPDAAAQARLLWDTPAALYGFTAP